MSRVTLTMPRVAFFMATLHLLIARVPFMMAPASSPIAPVLSAQSTRDMTDNVCAMINCIDVMIQGIDAIAHDARLVARLHADVRQLHA
jgi:hypothetical protein